MQSRNYSSKKSKELIYWANANDLTMMEDSLNRRANINYKLNGSTALHIMTSKDCMDGVRFLIHRGADPTITNSASQMPVDLTDNPELIALLFEAERNFRGLPSTKLSPRELSPRSFEVQPEPLMFQMDL